MYPYLIIIGMCSHSNESSQNVQATRIESHTYVKETELSASPPLTNLCLLQDSEDGFVAEALIVQRMQTYIKTIDDNSKQRHSAFTNFRRKIDVQSF